MQCPINYSVIVFFSKNVPPSKVHVCNIAHKAHLLNMFTKLIRRMSTGIRTLVPAAIPDPTTQLFSPHASLHGTRPIVKFNFGFTLTFFKCMNLQCTVNPVPGLSKPNRSDWIDKQVCCCYAVLINRDRSLCTTAMSSPRHYKPRSRRSAPREEIDQVRFETRHRQVVSVIFVGVEELLPVRVVDLITERQQAFQRWQKRTACHSNLINFK